MRSRRIAGGVLFGMVVETSDPLHLDGMQLGLHEAAYWTEGEWCEVIVRPRTETLVVDVDDWLVSLLGWRLPKGEVRPVPEAVATALVAGCEGVTERARVSHHKGKELSTAQLGKLRTRVIGKLQAALEPWLSEESLSRKGSAGDGKSREYYRIVQKARHAMARWNLDEPLGVGKLASMVNVSERTLYRAFREWVGMAPTEFFLVHKLHLFRTRLLEGPGGHGAVSRAAMEAGFDQLGRLSGTYKRQFGETPRETLRRRGRGGRSPRGKVKGGKVGR
jgi:AraC-like DNA-binding protein